MFDLVVESSIIGHFSVLLYCSLDRLQKWQREGDDMLQRVYSISELGTLVTSVIVIDCCLPLTQQGPRYSLVL